MKTYHKKGQALGAVSAIITLVIGVTVATLVMILGGALAGQTYNLVESDIDAIGNNTQTDFSFVASNSTAVTLGHSDIHSGSLVVFNESNGVNMNLDDFTIDYTLGTILTTNDTLDADTYLANYSWGNQEITPLVKDGIRSAFEAQAQTGDYMPLIVLGVVIFIILSLVLGFLAFGGFSGGNQGISL